MGSYKEFAKKAIVSGEVEGQQWFIVPGPLEGLNGYAVFEKRPTIETGYRGLLNYVPVHGGITFARQYDDAFVYGFDTAHCDSEEKPRTDPEWIKGQIAVMVRGIKLAAELEPQYLLAKTNDEKAPLCQQIYDLQPAEAQNFGVMLHLLSGEL